MDQNTSREEIPEWEQRFDEKWDGCFSDQNGDYVNPQVKDFIRAEIEAAREQGREEIRGSIIQGYIKDFEKDWELLPFEEIIKRIHSAGQEAERERVLAFIESQKKELEMQSDGEYHFVNNAKVASHNHALELVETFINDTEHKS